jgi:hypothetical protein
MHVEAICHERSRKCWCCRLHTSCTVTGLTLDVEEAFGHCAARTLLVSDCCMLDATESLPGITVGGLG